MSNLNVPGLYPKEKDELLQTNLRLYFKEDPNSPTGVVGIAEGCGTYTGTLILLARGILSVETTVGVPTDQILEDLQLFLGRLKKSGGVRNA